MGAQYRKLDPMLWFDAKVRQLSDAGLLALCVLLNNPYIGLTGAFHAEAGQLAALPRWPAAKMDRALAELTRVGILRRDTGTALLWLPKFLKYNPPGSPNASKALRRQADALRFADDELRSAFLAAVDAAIQEQQDKRTTSRAPTKDLPSPSEGASKPGSGSGAVTGSGTGTGTGDDDDRRRPDDPSSSSSPVTPSPDPPPPSTPDARRVPLREEPPSAQVCRIAALDLIASWNRIRSTQNNVGSSLGQRAMHEIVNAVRTRSLDDWDRVFQRVEGNDYLAGRTEGVPGLTLWKAIELAERIESGHYDKRAPAPAPLDKRAAAAQRSREIAERAIRAAEETYRGQEPPQP